MLADLLYFVGFIADGIVLPTMVILLLFTLVLAVKDGLRAPR